MIAPAQDTIFRIPISDYSRYANRLLHAKPFLREWIDEKPLASNPFAMANFLDIAHITDEATLKRKLRQLRQIVMLQIMAKDLSGDLALEDVFLLMTQFADFVLIACTQWITERLAGRYGYPVNDQGYIQHLIVIAMGKLGSRELNVSSDIDLVFLYPEDGETNGPKSITNDDFFTRLGKKIISTLSENTEDGFVFRVDMRLRPNGESGPLVCSLAALENYFILQGRDWERYAWLRARDITHYKDQETEEIIRPFVFRRYLDFGTFDAMRDIHHEIRRKVMLQQMQNNIKHGPGGIREVEFVVQAFQLIHGGKVRQLQSRSILETLVILAQKDLLAKEEATKLASAYRFLRILEHRIMYLDDAQTQEIPQNHQDLLHIALSMGFENTDAFEKAFNQHRQYITGQFDHIFSETIATDEQRDQLDELWQHKIDRTQAEQILHKLNYETTEHIIDQLIGLRQSVRYRRLTSQNRQRFDVLIPRVIALCAKCIDPSTVLSRTLALLEAVIRHGAYLAMLKEHPQALEKMIQICEVSRWATEYLIKHPILLDEMLDPRLLYEIPSWDEFRQSLKIELDRLVNEEGRPDMEKQMDHMRERHHALVFRLLAQDLAKLLPVETLSDHLSLLADIMLDETLKRCWYFIRERYPEAPYEPAFAVLGYGKLGGKELGYASDLDLVFIYDDDSADASDIYTKYVQRINSWLSTTTVSGKLFDIDMQLRPDGVSGLLVHSKDAFQKYQTEKAWIWEHQALTRARFVSGKESLGQWFELFRDDLLRQKRNLPDLKQAIIEMRDKMYQGHRHTSDLFDIKHDKGGIVDVEFMVQFLVLAYSHDFAELTKNLGNIALLRMSAEYGLIGEQLAEDVRTAYREYRRTQHAFRLNDIPTSLVEADRFRFGRQSVRQLWHELFEKSG